MRNCKESNKDLFCDSCGKLLNEMKELLANHIQLKCQVPNESGHKLPSIKEY